MTTKFQLNDYVRYHGIRNGIARINHIEHASNPIIYQAFNLSHRYVDYFSERSLTLLDISSLNSIEQSLFTGEELIILLQKYRENIENWYACM